VITRDIALLFLSRSLRMFANGSAVLVLVLYLAALGFEAGAIGILLALTLLGGTLFSLVLTTRADRWGRRRVLILGGILMSLASLTFVISDSFVILVAGAIIGMISPAGGDVGPFLPIEQASLSHLVPDRSRTPAFGWYQVAGSVSAGLGAMTGGFAVTLLKGAGWSDLDGYRLVIGFSVVVGFILAGIFVFASPAMEVERTAVRRGSRFGIHKSKRVVAQLSALFAVDSFASSLIPLGLVLYWIHIRFGVPELGLGGISLGFNFLTGISAPLSVWVSRRIGLVNTMVFTHIPASLMLMIIPFMPSAELAVAVVLIRAMITQMDIPVRQSYTLAVVEPDERSATAGVTNMVRSLSQAPGPGISTPLLVVPGTWVIPFLLGGLLKVGYDLSLWRLFRSRPAPEERQAEAQAAAEVEGGG
jgi:MFS family permease